MSAGVVETQSARVYSKGTTAWLRRAADAGMSRLAGVKSIGGVKFQRRGPVDATELAPAPVAANPEEPYYWAEMYPGTKEAQPIPFELNMSRIEYKRLITIFDNDETVYVEIRFRNGDFFSFYAWVADLDCDIKDDQLAQTPVNFHPVSKVYFNQVGAPTTTTPTPSTTTTTGDPNYDGEEGGSSRKIVARCNSENLTLTI